MPYAYVTLRFRGGFTSYSPVLHEGYLDSTTLQAALVAVEAELLGHEKPLLAYSRFTSLLPLDKRGFVPLLPPLRLPIVGGKVFGYWTPRAASLALDAIASCNTNVVLAYDADKDLYHLYCLAGGNVLGHLVYDPNKKIVSTIGEKVEFKPPVIRTDRHRLVVDRLTTTATPYMLTVVEPRTPYWFAAYLPSEDYCSVLQRALELIKYLGLGAYRSVGLGHVRVEEVRCGSIANLPDSLRGIDASKPGYAVSLGLLLPKEDCTIIYGRMLWFGARRGFGGRVFNFRRPLVAAAAPGSIVDARCTGIGRVESGKESPAPYVYSFYPLFYQ